MNKIFDNIFSGLMLAAGVAVVLAGTWVLSHSIEQARREPPPARPAQTQGLPAESVPVLCVAAEPTRQPGPDVPLDKPVVEALAESCEEYGGGPDGVQRGMGHRKPGVCPGRFGGGGKVGLR